MHKTEFQRKWNEGQASYVRRDRGDEKPIWTIAERQTRLETLMMASQIIQNAPKLTRNIWRKHYRDEMKR